ncbi:MAG: TatD family hydrolase [Desulfovibrionaceae bacterium]
MSKKKKPRPLPETLGLPRVGVDSHAHLDLDDFPPEELDELLRQASRAGVGAVGNVFLGPDAYDAAHERLAAGGEGWPELFFLLAVHPNNTGDCDAGTMERMRARFQADPRLRAVGETGLDYYWKRVPEAVQQEAFRQHLDLARGLGLPVVIHSRDADPDTLAVLEAEGFAGLPVLWHCFGAGPEFAERLLANGWHLSIPGPVTYKGNDALAEAVRIIPLERLLVETDCPFLTPEPWRGKRNHPALAAFTAAKVAEIKGLDPAEVWRAAGENARAFFGLPKTT